jgi:hypothetical protein
MRYLVMVKYDENRTSPPQALLDAIATYDPDAKRRIAGEALIPAQWVEPRGFVVFDPEAPRGSERPAGILREDLHWLPGLPA